MSSIRKSPLSKGRALLAGLATGLAAGLSLWSLPALATTDIVVHYPMPAFFKGVMDQISTEYMKEHPDVKITFTAPSPTYNDGLQLMLRENGTSDMPDISFIGLNNMRILAERGVGVDLAPFVAKDTGIKAEGFSDTILGLGQVKGRQVGLAFAASNPIFYYNADLVKKAGGDPNHMPDDWDGVFKLAAKINALGDGTVGMGYNWMFPDDWMFQALIDSNGGQMLSADEKKVAFDGPAGLAALTLLDRMVKEGKMPLLDHDATLQAFTAGKMGMFFWTTGALRSVIKGVGDKFTLGTTHFPTVPGVNGHLPTGGNVIVMFTQDPAKQQEVYKFMKFAAGPFGASVVVPGTGYVPNNDLAATDERYLKGFYEKNPLFQAGLKQMPLMVPWYAYPGSNGVKIQKTIVDNMTPVVEQKATPADALKAMSAAVQALLPPQ